MITYNQLQLLMELWGAVFTSLCAGSIMLEKKQFRTRSLLLAYMLFGNSLLLVNDAIALGFQSNPTTLGYYVVRVSNFMVFILLPILILIFGYFVVDIIQTTGYKVHKKWLGMLRITTDIHMLLIIINSFYHFVYYFDETNKYHRMSLFPVLTVFGLIELLILTGMIHAHHDYIQTNIRRVLLIYVFMPMISAVIQTFYYGIALNNIAATIALVLVFLTYEVSKASRLLDQQEQIMKHRMNLKNKELTLSRQEQELAEAKLQISLSQMQPHFIFNSLGSIEQLCRIDANKAAEATHHFAGYLRNNLLALNTSELKTFHDELRHIHTYIWLENMRFGEDLCFTENIESENFMLPVLSVQPLIENCVNRGFRSLDEGEVHIRLATTEDDACYRIEVSDNITNFVPDFAEEEYFEKNVLTNIRDRLKIMANGTVVMKKDLHEGITFLIKIPKK